MMSTVAIGLAGCELISAQIALSPQAAPPQAGPRPVGQPPLDLLSPDQLQELVAENSWPIKSEIVKSLNQFNFDVTWQKAGQTRVLHHNDRNGISGTLFHRCRFCFAQEGGVLAPPHAK